MMMLQAIVIADQHYESHVRSTDFISQYIFPGGSLPSVSVLTSTAAKAAGMRILRLHDFAPHYAETLRRWREQFYANVSNIREQGFDERFIRMWEYYLCYCEAAFDERRVNLVQMLFAQRGCRHDSICQTHESKRVGLRDANRFEPQVVQ
jgi:cyclopropane-fatty-acyl-phospholipid synthase